MMMEKTNSNQLLLLFSISSLLFLSFPGSTTCQVQHPAEPPLPLHPAIEQICNCTSHPELCISTLTRFSPQMNSTATAILEMALNATLNLTEGVLADARLLAQTSYMDYGKSGIESCLQLYNGAVENLQKAVQAVADGDEGLFSSSVEEAIGMYWGCEDANTVYDTYGFYYMFVSHRPQAINHSPFKNVDSQLVDLATNCLNISRAIHWPSS